jgi:hypothetical protein
VAIAAIAVAGAVARSTSSSWGTFIGQEGRHAAQIAELEATRTRLREDRQAGLYDDADDADDAERFRTEYRRLGEEITAWVTNSLVQARERAANLSLLLKAS